MGLFVFFTHYVIAFVMLHTIVFNSYEYEKIHVRYYDFEYKLTDTKYKHPLWLILLFSLIFFIPLVNLIVFTIYIANTSCEKICYYKSFLTKKY